MFDDLLEAWGTLTEGGRSSDPTGSQRFTYRLGAGITKRDKDAADPSKPPPTPGTPAARRKGLVKGLGMRMGGKKPPIPIPKGTKAKGVDISGAKEESFFGPALHIWESSYATNKRVFGGDAARRIEKEKAHTRLGSPDPELANWKKKMGLGGDKPKPKPGR